MKILFLSHKFYPDIGGIEVNSEILADHFSMDGAEIHVVTWSKVNNSKTKDFPYKLIRNPRPLQLISEHRWADVVFENNPSLKLSWPLFFLKKPHVVAVHTWINRGNGKISFRDKLKLKWLKKANAVIAVSELLKGGTFSEATVIENSYNDQLFREMEDVKKTRDFVFLGRLVSDKGADMAIQLIKMLKDWYRKQNGSEEIFLTIIGEGPERKHLEELVRQLDMKAYVKFTGALSGNALVKCLNEHKYMLVPSRWKEPFGIVALEGMASGCLPIVSDGGGLPEAVGDAGLVFERNNIHSLFEKVVRLMEDPELEREIRSHFQEHLKKHTSMVVSERYLEIIKNAIQNDGRDQTYSFSSHR